MKTSVVLLNFLIFLLRRKSAQATSILSLLSQPSVAREICFENLGCYGTGGVWGVTGRVAVLPDHPSHISTKYRLFTRLRPDGVAIEEGNGTKLKMNNFKGEIPTKFIIHGFMDWGSHSWLKEMAQQFLIKEDANVICVDWSGGSIDLYAQAVANTRVVGAEIAKLIQYLAIKTNLSVSDVHLIGHSLGAHIAGYAGRCLDGKIGRITGMDPADPYFQNMDRLVRLDDSDAEFVDVIHTDAGSFLSKKSFINIGNGLGTWQPSGHVDTYVSGAIDQPGCSDNIPFKKIISPDVLDGFRDVLSCSHCRAYQYMTESITSSCPWKAYPCSSWLKFKTGHCLRCGDACNALGDKSIKKEGHNSEKYWLATGKEPPFCRYHYHIQLKIATQVELTGRLSLKLTSLNNDQVELEQVDDESNIVRIDPDITNHFDILFMSRADVGKVVEVQIGWAEESNYWLDLFQWNSRQTIEISHISIFSGENQVEYSFCQLILLENGQNVSVRNKC